MFQQCPHLRQVLRRMIAGGPAWGASIVLLVPLIASGGLLDARVLALAGSGERLHESGEEETPSPLALKNVRKGRRGEQIVAPARPSDLAGAIHTAESRGWKGPSRWYSLLPHRSGAVCRHDFRDGLGAPLLC